jgi:dipeptidyl aminopeptidase/acylaminoacyl peptidase
MFLAMTFGGPDTAEAVAKTQDVQSIPPPATIVAEGCPDVPASLYDSLRRYQNIRSASFADWAPVWNRGHAPGQVAVGSMLVLTRFADTTQVHRVAFPGADRYQLTFHPERVLSAHTRPAHQEFLYVADSGGGENYHFYLQGLEAGTVVRLTEGNARNVGPKWSPSGKLLAYSSNARNSRDMDVYVQDPEKPGERRMVKEVNGSWTVQDWSPDESRLVVLESISINESYVHLIDIASGATETLTPRRAGPHDPQVAYAEVRWSKDGKALYWVTDKNNEFQRLCRYEIDTKKEQVITADISWDIDGYDFSDDGSRIVVVANEAGLSTFHWYDGRSGLPFPGGDESPLNAEAKVVEGVKFRPGSHEFAFTQTSPRAAADAYSAQFHNEPEIRRWTSSETAGFEANAFAAVARIVFRSFDGLEISAFVYRPDVRKFPGKRPVIIDIHGGPESQERPEFLGRANYLINELGVVLVFPNVRGSSGYGKTYVTLDNGFKREDSVKDIGALLDWIAGQTDLDASRVGVTGGSYGGYMSLAVQCTYNDRIKVGIDIVGISNFVTFLTNTQGYRRDLRRVEYGDERDPEMRAFLERISPLGQAHKIKTPILVVQGKNDPRVPVTEAEQVVSAIRQNGGPVWYVLGTNEGHGFAKKANQDYLQAVEVLFWRKFLLEPSR